MDSATRSGETCTGHHEKKDDRFDLPGVTLPLDYCPEALNAYGVRTEGLFPSGLNSRDIERGYLEYVVRFSLSCFLMGILIRRLTRRFKSANIDISRIEDVETDK